MDTKERSTLFPPKVRVEGKHTEFNKTKET